MIVVSFKTRMRRRSVHWDAGRKKGAEREASRARRKKHARTSGKAAEGVG